MSGLRQRMARWWQRRLPPARTVQLAQAHIFIVPTPTGLAFMGALVLMLLLAINYQNSLAYALCFVLASLALLSALHTWRNLAGLQLQALASEACFADENLYFALRLNGQQHARQAIRLALPGAPPLLAEVDRQQSVDLLLPGPVARRGIARPGRIRVESRYPLGIWVAWSQVALEQQVLVYPQPLEAELGQTATATGNEQQQGRAVARAGVDDYQGLQSWQQGDAMVRIDWKAWSRGQGLWVRHFSEVSSNSSWLDFACQSGDAERRLSILCFHVLRQSAQGTPFGLRLPGQSLEPAQGTAHRDACLAALACFAQAEYST